MTKKKGKRELPKYLKILGLILSFPSLTLLVREDGFAIPLVCSVRALPRHHRQGALSSRLSCQCVSLEARGLQLSS